MIKRKYTQAARRHSVGHARVAYVLANTAELIKSEITDQGELKEFWLGIDDQGLELEIITVATTDKRTGAPIELVTHAMPTSLRRNNKWKKG